MLTHALDSYHRRLLPQEGAPNFLPKKGTNEFFALFDGHDDYCQKGTDEFFALFDGHDNYCQKGTNFLPQGGTDSFLYSFGREIK